MDIEELRESGDEQDDQENGHEEEHDEGQEEQNERYEEEQRDEADEQVDEIQSLESDGKQEEPDVNVESRQENRANSSYKSSRQSRAQSRAATPQNHSCMLNKVQPKRWRSANAFVNFVQDFKQEYPEMITGRNIFQTCGERWKSMTDEQKQPYVAAANTVKRLKNRKNGESSDQQSKKSVTRISKRKAESKRKESSQKRSKANNQDAMSNSDTDTATTTVHSSMSDPDSP